MDCQVDKISDPNIKVSQQKYNKNCYIYKIYKKYKKIKV